MKLPDGVAITAAKYSPSYAKMLYAGAKVFKADFEDACSPSWSNLLDGQVNLRDAINRKIDFTTPEGKAYKLNAKTATLMMRPRGWHYPEKHVLVDGKAMSGSLF